MPDHAELVTPSLLSRKGVQGAFSVKDEAFLFERVSQIFFIERKGESSK
jgi:hypothetical protein